MGKGSAELLFYISLLLLPGNRIYAQGNQNQEKVLKNLDNDRVFYYQNNKKYTIKEDDIKEECKQMVGDLDNPRKYDELKWFRVSYDLNGNGVIDLEAKYWITGIIFDENRGEITKLNMDYDAKEVRVDKNEDGHFEIRYSNEDNKDIYLETKSPVKGDTCLENILKKIEDERIFRFTENMDYMTKMSKIEEDPFTKTKFICVEYDYNGDGAPEVKVKFEASEEFAEKDSPYWFFGNKAKEVRIGEKDKQIIYLDGYSEINERGTFETKISEPEKNISDYFEGGIKGPSCNYPK